MQLMRNQAYPIRKQPLADIFQNRCFQKFLNIHKKTPVLKSLSNKIAGFDYLNKIMTRSYYSTNDNNHNENKNSNKQAKT